MDDEKFVKAQCACTTDRATFKRTREMREYTITINVCLYADRRMGKSFKEGPRNILNE